MSSAVLTRYVMPWKFRRDQERQRLEALRKRDGETCRRCRRPMRFDLPAGHDKGPKVETILTGASGEGEPLENLCLCHRRCNADSADNTVEVTERVRRKSEAALFDKARASRRKAKA